MVDVRRRLIEQTQHLASRPYGLAFAFARHRVAEGPDVMALLATHGQQDAEQLIESARAFLEDNTPHDLGGATIRRRTVGALAALLTIPQMCPDDQATAALLFRYAYALGRPAGQASVYPRLAIQANLVRGELDFVHMLLADPTLEIDEETRWLARTEILGPRLSGDAYDEGAWLDSLNELVGPDGVAPVLLRAGGQQPFLRLGAESPVGRTGHSGPMISVVMSVFSPRGGDLEAAARSILAQTWANLELLVIDDCSPSEYQPVIDAVGQLDDRVRILRMADNGGTYAIRNRALRDARGTYVTFQDSDDWSHPERLERQIAPLLADPELLGTLTRAVRATDELSIVAVGSRPSRVNASSLLFERQRVADRLGGFDHVRKGADSEFTERIALVFGEESICELDDIMAITQLTPASLSRGDFGFKWQAPSRVLYRQAFMQWHNEVREGRSSPVIDDDRRRFPAPDTFLTDPPVVDVPTPVVLVADLRAGFDGTQAAVDRAIALIDARPAVELAQVDDMHRPSRVRVSMAPALLARWMQGDVGRVNWDVARRAQLTLVDDPALLSLTAERPDGAVLSEQVVIVARRGPRDEPDIALHYDPIVVERNAVALFGIEPVWWASDAATARSLRREGVAGRIVAPSPFSLRPSKRRQGVLIAGLVGADAVAFASAVEKLSVTDS